MVLESQNFTRKGTPDSSSPLNQDFTHYFLLQRFSYRNNLIDIFIDSLFMFLKGNDSDSNKVVLGYAETARGTLHGWQDLLISNFGPFIQGLVAC